MWLQSQHFENTCTSSKGAIWITDVEKGELLQCMLEKYDCQFHSMECGSL